MRTFLAFAALCSLSAFAICAKAAPAKEQASSDQVQQQQQTADTQHAETKDAAADPNYRRHNGRWWYWQNDAWLMWNGQRWLNESERQAYAVPRQRSFSYAAPGETASDPYVPTPAGMPRSDASGMRRGFNTPGTVEYQKVLPSYGIRSAGSKVLGEY